MDAVANLKGVRLLVANMAAAVLYLASAEGGARSSAAPATAVPGRRPSAAAAVSGRRRALPPPSPPRAAIERSPRPSCLGAPLSAGLAVQGRRQARTRMEEAAHNLGALAAAAVAQARRIGGARGEVGKKIRK